jgi:hypothetical protein
VEARKEWKSLERIRMQSNNRVSKVIYFFFKKKRKIGNRKEEE